MLVEQEATLETCKAILPCESVRCSIIASSTTTADIRLDADIAIADLVSVTDCFTPAVPSVKDAGRHTVIFNHLSVDEFLSHHTALRDAAAPSSDYPPTHGARPLLLCEAPLRFV